MSSESTQYPIPASRSYQEEMYQASLCRNIVIVMPTGSGKTHVAALRLKKEAEREPNKVSWFIAPNVALCEQQQRVIRNYLGLPVGLITGALQPEQWTNAKLWKDALQSHRILVSTPQVLLDAMRHGYVRLGSDVGLIVFDEAHHTAKKHPYNLIMREFYDRLERRDFTSFTPSEEGVQPFILGLTASPMFGGNVDKAFEKLEENLNATILSPKKTRSDLDRHVHMPTFKLIQYPPLINSPNPSDISLNIRALADVVLNMRIEDDPTVRSLRRKLASLSDPIEHNRVDQRLSEAVDKKNTFVHKGMNDFLRTAQELCYDVGPWGADWYIDSVIKKALVRGAKSLQELLPNSRPEETEHFVKLLRSVRVNEISYSPDIVAENCSEKTEKFIEALLEERESWVSRGKMFSGLVFVTRRDCALALSNLLAHHPRTKSLISAGILLGSSESNKRNSFIDISRSLLPQKHSEVISDFRSGVKNVVVATSVAEEGLDIPNCGTVIRWNPPNNVVSWVQSRGRARHEESTFILLFEKDSDAADQFSKWYSKEMEMKRRYEEEHLRPRRKNANIGGGMDLEFSSPSGAKMTSQAVLSHMAHFCSKLSGLPRADTQPIFDLNPPDYPIGYHAIALAQKERPLNHGPFQAILTLPRLLPPHLRIFRSNSEWQTKDDARKEAAFIAYKSLYDAGLLNENLLPEGKATRNLRDGDLLSTRNGVLNLTQKDPWQSVVGQSESPMEWYESYLEVEGVGSLRFFTRTSLRRLGLSSIALHGPSCGQLRNAIISPKESVTLTPVQLTEAQHFTRRLLSVFHWKRLEWDNLDFVYLFLPALSTDDPWEERRTWAIAQRHADEKNNALDLISANLASFCLRFGYPADLGLLVDSWSYFEFKAWRKVPLNADEEAQLRKRYRHLQISDITYPVVEARPVKHRMNYLVSVSDDGASSTEPVFLLPSYSRVILESKQDTALALFLPSILRAIFTRITAMSLQTELLDKAPSLTSVPVDLVQMALMTPSADIHSNYERLETLGDTVLKLVATIQLLAAHPHWPEGFVIGRRHRVVSNATLSEVAAKNHLHQWIMRTPFVMRRWTPSYLRKSDMDDVQALLDRTHLGEYRDMIGGDADGDSSQGHTRVNANELGTKTLADVVESLIGAAYLTGGFDCSIDCMNVLGINIDGPWRPLSKCITEVSNRCPSHSSVSLGFAEKIIGYNFRNKGLLLEALMHANCLNGVESMSYERLQLAGDAVLDMIVIDALYRTQRRSFTPKEMHSCKAAIVNGHFLAFVCLRAHTMVETAMPAWNHSLRFATPSRQEQKMGLYQCFIHTEGSILDEQRRVVERFEKSQENIRAALRSGSSYPWAPLADICAPKWFGDIIESLIGAIYFDSEGDINTIKEILESLGIMELLDRLKQEDIDVTHPVTRVTEWAGKHQALGSLRFVSSMQNDKVACSLEVFGKTISTVTRESRGILSEDTLRVLVAEEALPNLMRSS